MKKILIFVISICMLFTFTACGKNNTSENISQNRSVFPGLFETIANDFESLNYNNCRKLIESSGYACKSTIPTSNSMGILIVRDDDDFELKATFSPNDVGEDALTLLTYSNGNYEVSVSDEFHNKSDVSYNVFNLYSDPMNKEVKSMSDLIDYIQKKVPKLIKAHSDEITNNKIINVALRTTYEIIDGKVYFNINTNLPDNTELLLTLSNDSNYCAQSKVFILDGKATSDGFTDRYRRLNGHYTLTVGMGIPKFQDYTVTSVIGINGEFLSGKQVTIIDGYNSVEEQFEYEL